jgi:gliding motility-associated-like protein
MALKGLGLISIVFAVFIHFLPGCKKSDNAAPSKTILFVPTAFTPNGDHHNDTFGIQASVPLTYFHIKIYDNTNILIFESEDLKKCWDGTYNSQPEPSGSYPWIIEYEADGVPRAKMTRSVELLR